jgi:hypothetical protein
MEHLSPSTINVLMSVIADRRGKDGRMRAVAIPVSSDLVEKASSR